MPINITNAVLAGTEFRDKSASYSRRVFRWDGPALYVTGGEVLNLTNTFGLGTISLMLCEAAYNGSVILIPRYNFTTKCMQWFDLAGAEVAANTVLSAYTFRAEAIGK